MAGKKIRITAVQRAMAEAQGFAAHGYFDATPISDHALTAMAQELKGLRQKVTILYLATAVGAFLVISQSPAGATISLLGAEIPLTAMSKQATALILAGAFSYYGAAFISMAMLYGTMAAIARRWAAESWEFLLCRYDSDALWSNMLHPKRLGAPSPKSERAIAKIVIIANLAFLSGHIALVAFAIWTSFQQALEAGSLLGGLLGGLAIVAILATAVSATTAMFLPLTYELPEAPPSDAPEQTSGA